MKNALVGEETHDHTKGRREQRALLRAEQRVHFDSLFSGDPDPWQYRTAWKERRRFSLMLSMLSKETYSSAFEPACATGMFTSLLAPRCDHLLACDGSSKAIEQAERFLVESTNITLKMCDIPGEWPAGIFDLVVLVDFLYYLPREEIVKTVERAVASLEEGATILVGHWLGSAHDFVTAPRLVHRIVNETISLAPSSSYVDDELLLELWTTP